MKKTLLIFLLLPCAVAGVQLLSCRKPPDPCAGLKPVSADFNFYQKFDKVDSVYKVDTVYRSHWRSVTFSAMEKNATYKWELEDYDKTPPTTQSFSLFFKEPYGKIAIQLSVKKEPNISCFPTDDGVDTITKNLYVADSKIIKPAFLGTFTGYLTDNPNDVFDITIVDFGPTPHVSGEDMPGYGIRVFNLPKGCKSNTFTPEVYAPEIVSRLYRSFYIKYDADDPSCTKLFTAFGRVYDNNAKIIITFLDYDYDKKKERVTNRKFLGTRKK